MNFKLSTICLWTHSDGAHGDIPYPPLPHPPYPYPTHLYPYSPLPHPSLPLPTLPTPTPHPQISIARGNPNFTSKVSANLPPPQLICPPNFTSKVSANPPPPPGSALPEIIPNLLPK